MSHSIQYHKCFSRRCDLLQDNVRGPKEYIWLLILRSINENVVKWILFYSILRLLRDEALECAQWHMVDTSIARISNLNKSKSYYLIIQCGKGICLTFENNGKTMKYWREIELPSLKKIGTTFREMNRCWDQEVMSNFQSFRSRVWLIKALWTIWFSINLVADISIRWMDVGTVLQNVIRNTCTWIYGVVCYLFKLQ